MYVRVSAGDQPSVRSCRQGCVCETIKYSIPHRFVHVCVTGKLSSQTTQGRPSVKKRKITCSSKKLLTQSLETNPDAPNKSEVQRKKRSQEYCKQKRKRYRQKKKQLAKQAGENLALEALMRRWRERCENACAIKEAEACEREREEEEERLRVANLQEVKAAETGLLRASMENLEAKWLEMTCRMQQMEGKLANIQIHISEHSETPSSSDSSSTTSSRKRKRRTPVSLQVCKPIFPLLSILPL